MGPSDLLSVYRFVADEKKFVADVTYWRVTTGRPLKTDSPTRTEEQGRSLKVVWGGGTLVR